MCEAESKREERGLKFEMDKGTLIFITDLLFEELSNLSISSNEISISFSFFNLSEYISFILRILCSFTISISSPINYHSRKLKIKPSHSSQIIILFFSLTILSSEIKNKEIIRNNKSNFLQGY
jgi:hypothetical protein